MRRNRSGSAVVEFALMMPWLAFLFVGVLDFGFYSFAAICTESAARVAAFATSGSPAAATALVACPAALAELKGLPNITQTILTNGVCAADAGSITNLLPVAVTVNLLNCPPTTPASTPPAADCAAQPIFPDQVFSSQVAVTYQTVPMIPIPGVLMSRMTLTRIAEMRISQ